MNIDFTEVKTEKQEDIIKNWHKTREAALIARIEKLKVELEKLENLKQRKGGVTNGTTDSNI
jgi:DNA-binding protein H-NS